MCRTLGEIGFCFRFFFLFFDKICSYLSFELSLPNSSVGDRNVCFLCKCMKKSLIPIAPRMAKNLSSFGHSECSRVNYLCYPFLHGRLQLVTALLVSCTRI